MANKRTIINADEELIIQGSLIVEGQFIQKEFVETVSYTESKFLGDVLIVNADGFDLANNQTSATLRLRSGSSNTDIVWDASELSFSANITAPNLNVSGNLTGYLDGTAKNAEAFVNSVTVGLSGDASGSATFINAGDTATISTTLSTVNATTGTFGAANKTLQSITVNGKGLVTEIVDTPISITNSQVTDFVSGVRSNVSAQDAGGDGSFTYNQSTGVFTYTGPSASEVRAHFSGGTGVTITNGVVAIGQPVGTSDSVTFTQVTADLVGDVTGQVSDISNHDTDALSEGTTNLYYTDARARAAISRVDAGGDGSLTYNSTTGVITYTGPSASEVRAHFSGGTGVTITNGVVAIGQPVGTTDSVTFTQVTADLVGDVTGQVSDISNHDTDDLSEGSNNLYFTTARARAAISHVDNGGDGSLTYNNTTGVISYTGPSAAEVRAHFSGGDGINLVNGDIAVDNTVVRTSGNQSIAGDKTFTGNVDLTSAFIVGGITVQGDLDVIGDINSVTQTDLLVTDASITLRQGASTDGDAHIYVVATGNDPYLKWDTGSNRWQFNDGTTTYNMLTEADTESFFSVVDAGGDGSLNYANGVFTYTGPSPSEVRAHFSAVVDTGYGNLTYNNSTGTFTLTGVSDAEIRARISVNNQSGFGNLSYDSANGIITHVGVSTADIRQQLSSENLPGGDGVLTYYSGNGVIQYQGPTQSEANSRVLGAADQVRSHFNGGYAIDLTGGTISLDTVPDTITFAEGHVKLLNGDIGIGEAAGSFLGSTSNAIAIGYESGSTNQRSSAVSIGVQAGRLDQSEASIAIGYLAGRSYQGANVSNASAIAIGSYAGYLSQKENAVALGTAAGLFQQGAHSVAVGSEAGNVAQGTHSVALGPFAGQNNQPDNSIVIRAGDPTTYPAVNGVAEGGLYISPIRTLANKTGNVLMYEASNAEVLSVPSTEFVSSSFNQVIAGIKTFTDELVIPDTATTTNGAIYFDAATDKAYIRINGTTQEITPAVSVGTVAGIGASGISVYAGNVAAGNTTTHYVKSIDAGTYTTVSESANVITVDGDIAAIRGAFSVSDVGGDGSLTYNNSTGTFTYTGPSASEVRAHFSAGTGITLVNGVISATGDNYGSWSVQTDSGAGSKESISSTETLQIVGGTNITVTNVGNVITVRNDNTSDITAVTAGSGLTGGGSAGDVTLNIGAGTGVTVDADSISIGQDVATTADVIFGTLDVTGNAIIEGDLTVNGNTFSINTTTLSVTDNMIYLNANSTVTNPDIGFAGNYNDGTYAHAGFFRDTTDGYWKVFDSYTPEPDANAHIDTSHASFSLADIRADTFRGNVVVPGAYSLPTADGSTNQVLATNGSGQLSFQDVTAIGGTITGVTAGSGLTGGGIAGTVTLNVGAGTGITVNANDIAVDMTAFDTNDLGEGLTNKYFTDARARAALSGGTGIEFNAGTGVISLSDTGYVSGVTAGDGLTGGGTSGNITLNVVGGYGITVNADSIQVANSEVRGLFSGGTGITYNNSTGEISLSDTGYVSGVTAGAGLTGGGSSGNITLNIGAGAGITVNANDVALTSGIVTASTKGSASKSVSITVDTYGRVTSLSDQDIAITSGQVSGLAASATTDATNASNISSGTLASARLPDLTVADFAGEAIQTSAEAFSDSDTVLMTAAAVADKIESYGYTTEVGDITGVTAGTGLSGGGTSGSVTLNVSGLTLNEFAASAIQTSAEAFADNNTSLMTSAAIEDRILSKGYSTVDTLKAVKQLGLITLQLDDASGFVDEVLMSPSNHIEIDSGGPGIISFSTDATSANTGGTLVARDGSGNFSAGVITATATAARYADLAEKYATDVEYEPGTVVVFGGVAEVTECIKHNSPRVAGVISTDPAYMMNESAQGQYVALRGRVPCKVVGKVRKGDVLITSDVPGHAVASDQPHFVGAACIVGKAIGSKDTDGVGVVEVLV